jgi:hypothetical protein
VKAKKKQKDRFPVTVETFRELGSYEIVGLEQTAPSCCNGYVWVEKYRITVERVEEPVEVIHARIIELWETCNNPIHYAHPLRQVAEKWGLDLSKYQLGSRRKRT